MKIGIIGCGGMGTTHYLSLRALAEQEGVEVTCIAECRKEFLDKAASYFPNARTYEYGMDLIKNEELDIVHICLPSYMHAEHAIAALEKGMNVFVEKPVCLTEEDCQALLDAEKRSGKKVMVGQVVRSFKEYKFLKEAYDSGRYGKLKSMVMQRISGDVRWGFENWFQDEKKSGSVVLDLHVHDLDFIRYMLGEPKSMDVKATEFPSGMVNQIVASYEYDDTFVTAEGIWDISPSLKFHATYRACFEKATLVFDSGATPALEIYKPDGEVEIPELPSEYEEESDVAGINISNLGPYFTEIKYFFECVRDDKPVELAPLSEGVKSAELAIKEWKMAKEYIEKKKHH